MVSFFSFLNYLVLTVYETEEIYKTASQKNLNLYSI